MNEPTSLGAYLKRERECRGLALGPYPRAPKSRSLSLRDSKPTISRDGREEFSAAPSCGLTRSVSASIPTTCCAGSSGSTSRRSRVDPASHPYGAVLNTPEPVAALAVRAAATPPPLSALPRRARMLGTAADLTVAVVLAFGSAAAGSRLLWPVLLISAYYAVGVLLTGTSPMVALLCDQPEPRAAQPPAQEPAAVVAARQAQTVERRLQPRRTNERPRQRRGAQSSRQHLLAPQARA